MKKLNKNSLIFSRNKKRGSSTDLSFDFIRVMMIFGVFFIFWSFFNPAQLEELERESIKIDIQLKQNGIEALNYFLKSPIDSFDTSKFTPEMKNSLKELKRDYICDIYGDGKLKGKIKLDNPNIRLHNNINHKKIPELLSNYNVLVFPSIIPEAFGRVAIEAMAAGCLPIASRIGGVTDIITDKKNTPQRLRGIFIDHS